MARERVRMLRRFGMTGAAVLLLTGCPEDAANIVETKASSLDFDVAPMAPVSFPAGGLALTDFVITNFDTTAADAFNRGVAGTGSGYAGGGWDFTGYDRNASTDPRFPTIVSSEAFIDGTGVQIFDPSLLCASPCPFHNPWLPGLVRGLNPDTEYIVALFRYGIEINGELDGAQIAMRAGADALDQLVAVGGAPAGDPTVNIESFPTFNALLPNANPAILGHFVSDANGVGGFDVVLDGTAVLYSDNSGTPVAASFDSALVARNDDTQTTFPRYNYLVILEGPAATAVEAADNDQVLRVQIGQDFLASTGEPVNNAYAPFPTPFSFPDLFSLPTFAGRPNHVTVELLNVEPLAGAAQYNVWLVNRETSTLTPAEATYERVAILRELNQITGEIISASDSVLDSQPTTSTFAGQLSVDLPDVPNRQDPAEVKHRFVITDASLGGGADSVGFFTDVVVTVESGQAATPGSVRPLWFRFTDQGGTPNNFFDDAFESGQLLFGQFDMSDPSGSRVFSAGELAQSSGFGGVLDTGESLPREVSVDIRNLPLPPVGYYYEGWLTNAETGATISMGPLTALPPDTVSLIDADVSNDLPGVTPTGIRFGNAHVILEPGSAVVTREGQNFTVNYTQFFLTLEPKAGAASKNVADLEIGSLPTATIVDRMRN